MKKHYEIYQDTAGNWRWHLKGANGEIMAHGEPHRTVALAHAAVRRVKRSFLAPVVVSELRGT